MCIRESDKKCLSCAAFSRVGGLADWIYDSEIPPPPSFCGLWACYDFWLFEMGKMNNTAKGWVVSNMTKALAS